MRNSKSVENTTSRKLDLLPFPGEGKEIPTLLGHLKRGRSKVSAQLFLRSPTEVSLSNHMRMETDPISKTLRFLII
jgi:hypothetical protein